MIKPANIKIDNEENRFLHMYKMVQEREKHLTSEAKVIQYGGLLRYFMKFLQQNDEYSTNVLAVLFWIYVKLGDIYYKDALQNQDNSRFFLAIDYYNQSLAYANGATERNRVLLALKDIYYYLDDQEAFVKVEETWAENHDKKNRFSAYVFLAQNAEDPYIKAMFLEKALNEVMEQDESFYTKYQDTLNVCSQLVAIYELLGDKGKANKIKKLRESTLKLLN